jgi:hypothetical protein
MVIRYSNQLLEQLSEVEEKISMLEKLMEELNVDWDKESLIRKILARKYEAPSGQ